MIRLVFILNFLIVCAFANISLTAPNSFFKDEAYVFSIEVIGSDITFPKLDRIDGNIVLELGTSSSTNIINGNIKRSIKKTYSIRASKEFEIPSLEFKVDGKKFYTKKKLIKINIPKKTNSSILDLSIKANKNELFVGENFILTLVFKFKKNTQIVDLKLSQPDFDGFWFKQLDNTKKYTQNTYEVQELNFLLFPLKEGSLKINPISLDASIVNMNRNFNSFFSTPTKTLKIYSNDLDFNIKALPPGVNLIGDFNIEASIDKETLHENEAVSYKLKISGFGNIEDIEDIKLNIENTTIYENKAKIEAEYKNGLYKGIYTKTFSIIPSTNIVIPSLTLKYFDKEKKQVIEKRTKNFNIKLKEENKVQEKKLEKAKIIETKKIEVIERNSSYDRLVYFFLGVFVSILILGLYLYVIKQKEKKRFNESSLVKKIKSSQSKDALLKVLAIYINKDKNLDRLIFDLEKSDNIKTIKKEIIKLLKTINFKG